MKTTTIREGRVSVRVEMDELELAEPEAGTIAEAIARAVGEGIANNSEQATAATVRRRGGGNARYGYDTGTLARGIHAELQPDGSYAIMPPQGRLDPADFRSPAAYDEFRRRLAEAVPAIEQPLEGPAVEAAIAAELDRVVR
jgi:hypothetical protein